MRRQDTRSSNYVIVPIASLDIIAGDDDPKELNAVTLIEYFTS